jgi:glutamate 5-kinase
MRGVKTVVVKLGSSTVSDPRGRLRRGLIAARVAEIAALVTEGQRVVVVSSGAIACGQSVLGIRERPRQIAALQAASAVGQGKLFDAYAACLRGRGLTAAQILLTSADFAQRLSYVNARSTLRRLLGWGVVPIINENDTTATDEIRFGDNDVLAAQVAIMLRADTLLLLTDRDGLFSSDPESDPAACLIARVDDAADLHGLDVREHSHRGAGGMRGKVAAALMAAAADVGTVIANGARDGVITAAAHGVAVGTIVPPRPANVSAFKLWLRYAKPVRGTLEIDAGAARALAGGGGSLLPVGVVAVHGGFGVGDAVTIVTADGREVARGLATIGARELRRIAGMRSAAARAVVPHADEEVVHRDALVLVEEDTQ